MPHPQSPHPPAVVDLTGDFEALSPPKETGCTPLPLISQTPLLSTSPRPPLAASAMATAFQEPPPLKEQRHATFMNATDPNAMQWPTQNDFPAHQLHQNGYHLPSQIPLDSATFFNYNQNSVPYNDNYNLTYSTLPGSSCPRTYTDGLDVTGLPGPMLESYPPAAYQIEPQGPHEAMELSDQNINGQLMQSRDDYDHYCPIIKHEDRTAYSSPYDSDVTRSSTPNGDPPMPPHEYKNECAGEEVAIDKEQPYAQLIYRALLEAPGHTMILRDIYDWFKKNTDKAADKETKGWQNSIRHNLSMNGAFEKVDQPCEESKKGFMWRLTEKAIQEGVKSTTRYRSKQPNKRGHRSHNPLPQRQASGAKGGQAARRSARMRKSHRMIDAHRTEPHGMSRSVPLAYDAFNTGMAVSYHPPSPYCSSAGSDAGMEDLNSGMSGPGFELFPPRSYNGTPFSQDTTLCGDTGYIQIPLDPSDPLFTNSPSPTADEPRTPDSQDGGWEEDMVLSGAGIPYVFDTSYSEFPV